MKTFKYLALAACLLLGSCQANNKNHKLYEEGISLELAQLRKQEIKDLKFMQKVKMDMVGFQDV